MIVGLTDQQAAFPIIGELRKGEKKTSNKPGKDLDYFRFTSQDTITLQEFYAAYPEQPRQINIFLPQATASENFDAWMEEWVAGGLVHRCDGRVCALHRLPDGSYSTEPVACPGNCKQVGRLSAIVPELGRLATVTILTTSINDIKNLMSQLKSYEALRGDLRGIPFVVTRRPRKISVPLPNGNRGRYEKWLLSIESQPDWTKRQLLSMEQAALPEAVDDDPIPASYQVIDQLPANATSPFDEQSEPEPETRKVIEPEKLKKHLANKVASSKLIDTDTGEFFPINILEPFGDKAASLIAKHLTDTAGSKEDYRKCLWYLFDVESAKDLSAAEAGAILDWLLNGEKHLGFKAAVKAPAPEEARLIVEEVDRMSKPGKNGQDSSEAGPPRQGRD